MKYPFPNDPGAQVPVAEVIMAVRLPDGRLVAYAGYATQANYEMLHDGATLDINSPSGVAQAAESHIAWVSGTVIRRSDGVPGWDAIKSTPAVEAALRELETNRKEIEAGPDVSR